MPAVIDLTSQRYGRLEVLHLLNERSPDRQSRWLCRCDCGREVAVKSGNLKNGHTQSCGCAQLDGLKVQQAERRLDLTGKQFGQLHVLGPAVRRDGRSYFRCRCACGRTVTVRGTHLSQGLIQSCGCVRQELIIDLVGKQYGKLTVLRRSSRKGGSRETCWVCRCECGRTVTVVGSALRRGNTQSCGCNRKDRLIDLVGRQFGQLTVVRRAANKDGRTRFTCRCTCGRLVTVLAANLRNEHTRSCGCRSGKPDPVVAPGQPPIRPAEPRSPCVVLQGENAPVMVNGQRKAPLPPSKFRVVAALLAVWPAGLTKDELAIQGDHSVPHKLLKELCDSDADWAAVIERPGRGYRGGYRIR